MLIRGSLLAFAVTLTAFGGSQIAKAQGAFTLTSPDFKDGARLATKNAGNNKSNPNCVGENISPGIVLEQSARGHQELRADDVRSGRPSAGRRQPLGGLWHSGCR